MPADVTYHKRPTEVADFSLSWHPWLAYSDKITAVTHTVQSGAATVVQESYEKQLTILRVAGGVDGQTTTVHAKITTDDGQSLVAVIDIDVSLPTS